MSKDKVTELLKNYKSYKAAIEDYERPYGEDNYGKYMVAAPCRTAGYSDMPMGGSYGPRVPKLTGDWYYEDFKEYEEYQYVVRRIGIALDALNTDERTVITLKWLDDFTLDEISQRKRFSLPTVKRIHRRALEKLEISLKFVRPPGWKHTDEDGVKIYDKNAS
ncbi:sigma factor-like helix-turn-helix DNA-binding protein [Paenibacillus sp. H1-7]|uniref:sigma factor-like helix-turn-helix DNA-binding protein n=1 Tax=Paenibacillus sp. H1-7 TaxID=2282849 RepID=UPI001EF96A1B|nr:sigma factor-like helix-turn-helix DNA-binding protein [Paenibacillus sp. H1-7]